MWIARLTLRRPYTFVVIDAERTLQANQLSLAKVERWHSFLDRGEL